MNSENRGGPLVSVVIPTRNRPQLVCRAVESALVQTYGHLEVIVVIDGPDDETERALKVIEDPRLRVVVLSANIGGSGTRTVGAREARGKWVAFLDDDDEWDPTKIEKQIKVGEDSSHRLPVVSSSVIARSPEADYIWPSTKPFLPVADYLMQRNGLFQGDGLLQTSTLLIPSVLLRDCPFTPGLRKHQDWDWLIRALRLPGTGIEFLTEPLVIWHIEEKRKTISAANDWRFSAEWLESIRGYCSSTTYAAFLLTVVGASAAEQRCWSAFATILRTAFAKGTPRTAHVALFCAMWLVPRQLRWSLRRLCHGRSPRNLHPVRAQ